MDVDKWLGSVNLYEAAQVWARFDSACEPHRMVLWSGIGFEQAEDWARQHDRKSLTQAMGPLMDKSNPSCRRNIKNDRQWCLYVHAASILFALFISTGSEVVVLARHPPDRFNPDHESYYQNIEEPWLTACCDPDKFRIMLAHPEIEGAGNCLYQYWPVDRVDDWKSMFPHPKVLKTRPWPHHSRKSLKTSEYHEVDLRRKRHAIMEKLYLYKTGASIYWAVTISTSRATVNQSTKKRRREIDNQKLRVEANASQANASTLPHQAKSDSPKTRAKSTCKIQAKSVSNSKRKLVSKSQAKLAPKSQAQPTPKTQAKSTSKAQDNENGIVFVSDSSHCAVKGWCIETTVVTSAGSRLSLPGRGLNAYKGYYVDLASDGTLVLGHGDGETWTQIQSVNVEVKVYHRYRIKVQAVGSNNDVYFVDMAKAVMVTTDSSYGSGTISGARMNNSVAIFCSFAIRRRYL
ncbi:arabinan endo-1,5-alpha-L-arabinosidase A [Beauveria bassiana ARSEF 2860]|uniref:Arabinan endo-1,5-alpha-L-arabinosidase A n=1 Tax=Beauveria bassiana (strain ARSEF 2860) TaxID=655819 RepID=J5JMW8_BEAB2|nr:arabinan endo-1,5-alpha-L-arabinosidase A [Beauveria bassiana ARSEF 2860]EJP64386.1 arabinan endo-1,5-alpha-L-arabinosidase A [Beauveria bassiana ARSEF 2860]